MNQPPFLSVQAKEDQDHTGRYTGYTKLEMIYKHQEEQEVTNDPLPPPHPLPPPPQQHGRENASTFSLSRRLSTHFTSVHHFSM
jgi:hypothetical protein